MQAESAPAPSLQSLGTDLWQITATPDSLLRGSTTSTRMPSISADTHSTTLMRAIADAEAQSPATTAHSQSTVPAIQRVETTGASSSGNVQQPTAPQAASETDDEDAADQATAEVDVDKLARQVYAQLKRRIRIEWERGRGRV